MTNGSNERQWTQGGRPAVPLTGRLASMRDAVIAFREKAQHRWDAWINDVTGFGTTRDKTTYGYVLPNRILTDEELSALYHHDDMAARMVDVVPQEMLREGFQIDTTDAGLDAAIASKLNALDVRSALADGVRWDRCYGGSAILLGCDDGRDASLPLFPERARDIDYLYVMDRRLLWPATYYNDPGPKLGKPKTYIVTTIGGTTYNTAEVHESRLILFEGAHTGVRERIELSGWGLSVMQRAYDVLRQFNTGWKAVETLMTDGNQAIFKMGGLQAIIESGGQEMLRERMAIMELYRSVMRAIVIDADNKESFDRHSVSFSEIPATLDKFMLRLAAAVQMPVTILMGQSPAGMNATGESDFRWFYDRIRASQNTDLTPRIRRIVDVWLATKAGTAKKPATIEIKYPALWTETPLARAQREQAIATRDAAYIDKQVLTPDEVKLNRFGRPDGFENEIALTKESKEASEKRLAADLEALNAPIDEGTSTEGEGTDETIDPNATLIAPTETSDPAAGPAEGTPEITLAPTDLAAIVKVNEARASVGLSPLLGADGEMTVAEFKAKFANVIAQGAAAEQGLKPGEEPAPSFGGPPGGGPTSGGEDEETDVEDLPKPAEEPTDEDMEDETTPPFLRSDYTDRTKVRTKPRTFELLRAVDETGVSGTGSVAEGAVFEDGTVVLRWKTKNRSTTFFDSVEQMLSVHGHGGLTGVKYHDEEDDSPTRVGE